ncbi:MAG TPA: imidazolonepropionase [Bacteriovoracaceae bacterium]|nr:imidazolonepropionase [Bacteriovoracaceae bacterium]
MKIYKHLNQIVTMELAAQKDGRRLTPSDLSVITDGAVVISNDVIEWVGPTGKIPAKYKDVQEYNLKGMVLTPELIDSHTHVVFGGDRAQEYADRLNGISYEEIAKRGGGILFTMNQTNSATDDELFEVACERINRIHSYGVGTIEIKSGYGLNFEKEYEVALLIDRLKKHFHPRIQIFNTYLAAHDVPRTFKSSNEYLNSVVIPLLEKLAPLKILDAVDIFHEKNYFSDNDVKALFAKAEELGIPRKMHADELNDNGGAALGVSFDSLSVDHLLKISDSGIEKLAAAPTVATLLPGTAFFLGKPLAPARKMLDAGVKVAIASDYNPGSCHCDNVLMIACISAAQLKLNQAELWAGITLNAAHALGEYNQGVIRPGMKARFTLFKAESVSHISYLWGRNCAVDLP